ncbi:MAG: chemotaxis protein CheD [Sporolactobacillus sp.]|nr:chemotaxis protein CheD [Sporolactobacillus sp.]MCI1883047.1 chemotaxis protein CheD [Sporolactobacillus sp.]
MIHVGLSEIKFAAGHEILRCMGLGSCVGIVIYDPLQKSAGMAHVMLPASSLARSEILMPGKYADTAIPALVDLMTHRHGLALAGLKAKMAGGAEMFKSTIGGPMKSIGARNVASVRAQLRRFGIPLLAEETGKNYGRTIAFYPYTGVLRIRTIFRGECIL